MSVDGFEKLNHYIRWPSNWDTVVENVRYLIENNHRVFFNTTVSMYNVADLYNLMKFFDDEFPGVTVHCQMAHGIADPLNFPIPEMVIDDLNKIKNLKCYQNDWLLSSFIDNIIKYFENSPEVNLQNLHEFSTFNQKLDNNRGVDLKDYSLALYQALGRVL